MPSNPVMSKTVSTGLPHTIPRATTLNSLKYGQLLKKD